MFGAFKTNMALRRELSATKELNTDLNAQVQDSLKRRAITPEEEADIKRIRQEHESLNKQIVEITIFLRNNFAQEIARGDHAGMTLAQVVCMYIGRARFMSKGEVQ